VDERSERVARQFELPVLIAALLVIPVIVVEQSDWGDPWKTLGVIVNWLIWLVFLAEVVTLIARERVRRHDTQQRGGTVDVVVKASTPNWERYAQERERPAEAGGARAWRNDWRNTVDS
jgi:hypothetical protein